MKKTIIMNKKGILKTGNDYDAILGNKVLCCIINIPFLRKFVKRKLSKYMRVEGKKFIKQELEEIKNLD